MSFVFPADSFGDLCLSVDYIFQEYRWSVIYDASAYDFSTLDPAKAIYIQWKLYLEFFFFFFWPRHVACRILVPRPGIKLVLPCSGSAES